MMCPEQYFTVGMNFLNMRKCLKEVLVQFFLPQCIYLQRGEALGKSIEKHTKSSGCTNGNKVLVGHLRIKHKPLHLRADNHEGSMKQSLAFAW